MKFSCASCSRAIEVPPGQSPPPWCSACGADFKDASSEVETPAQPQDAQQFAMDILGCQGEAARLSYCPTCKGKLPDGSAASRPPWCPKCGADLKTQVSDAVQRAAFSGEPRAPIPMRTTAASCAAGAASHANAYATFGAASDDDISRDGRFALHNFVVGAGLGIWGFIMAFGMAAPPGQDVLDSHGSLMTAIDMLQVLTIFNGVALFVSGVGLRQRQRWGYRLAAASGGVSILAGVLFLATWRFLIQSSHGGEVVEAVATMTFVRTNLDLLIGLVDGGALLLFLHRSRSRTTTGRAVGSGYATGWAGAN